MKAKFYISIFAAMAIFVGSFSAASAAVDPVVIKSEPKAVKINANEILRSAGQWTRVELHLQSKAPSSSFSRNVEVTLTMIYKNKKEQGNDDGFVTLKGSSKIFAIKGGATASMIFYIPWEAYEIYRLDKDPYAWHIALSVDGVEIPLSKSNIKTMISRNILKSSDPKKAFEAFKALAEKGSVLNEGVLMPLNECPYNVQYYEYYTKAGGPSIPTFIKTK